MGSIKRFCFHGCALASRNRDAKIALVIMMKIVVEERAKERSGFGIFSNREGVNLYILPLDPVPCFIQSKLAFKISSDFDSVKGPHTLNWGSSLSRLQQTKHRCYRINPLSCQAIGFRDFSLVESLASRASIFLWRCFIGHLVLLLHIVYPALPTKRLDLEPNGEKAWKRPCRVFDLF